MKVVHCKKSLYDVYIGRPSKWGNPFSHLNNTIANYKTNSRTEAIQKYKEWITTGDGSYLLEDLHELDGKVLGCWCGNFELGDKNYKCHGQILLNLIYTQRLF